MSRSLVSNSVTSNVQSSAHSVPPQIARRAVQWLLDWQSADDPDAVLQSISTWRHEHQDHDQAWRHIEKVNQKFDMLAGAEHSNVVHSTLTVPQTTRRDVLKTLSILLVAGGSGVLAYRQQPWQDWNADYHTGIGEQRHIRLADGTDITLNSRSAINVQFNAAERRVVLVKGEVYIKTGKAIANVNTPFVLQVPQGELQPLGTRFSARETDDACRVAVYEGQVRVTPSTVQHAESAMTINAGQALSFTQHNWSPATSVSESEAAWTQGMIVASNTHLSDFLTELNRHRSGLIQCDPSIANLKVSGTYPLNQADDVLQVLSNALPIKLQSFTRYWVRVLPNESVNS